MIAATAPGKTLVIDGNRGSFGAALFSLSDPQLGRLSLPELFSIAEWQDRVPWQPFLEGVEIHRLYGDGVTGPTAALIRFRAGGYVPLHEHVGYEHIIVLCGAQRDEQGTAEAGTMLVSAPGTQHRITSDGGCIVLAIYEKPVRFLPD